MQKMRAIPIGLMLLISATSSWAKLTCAENKSTFALMCFDDNKVRANANVRATPFYRGGPKGVDDTGFTARAHCVSKVLEVTDRKGIAFVRNVPTEQIGKDYVYLLCAHKKVKTDTSLSTN